MWSLLPHMTGVGVRVGVVNLSGVPGLGYRTGCRRREGSRNNGPKGSLGTIINNVNALVDEQSSIKYCFGFE